MKTERIEAVWLDEHYLSIDDLDERWGLNGTLLRELVEHGVLEPQAAPAGSGSFSLDEVTIARTACRLRQELELDVHAVGVVLELLRRLQSLQAELASLRARLPAEAAAQGE